MAQSWVNLMKDGQTGGQTDQSDLFHTTLSTKVARPITLKIVNSATHYRYVGS